MAKERRTLTKPAAKAASRGDGLDDTVLRSLSKDEVRRLSIDSWEPSLLRHMLEPHDKLRALTGRARAARVRPGDVHDDRPQRGRRHGGDR